MRVKECAFMHKMTQRRHQFLCATGKGEKARLLRGNIQQMAANQVTNVLLWMPKRTQFPLSTATTAAIRLHELLPVALLHRHY
jgi:hypothetical protein